MQSDRGSGTMGGMSTGKHVSLRPPARPVDRTMCLPGSKSLTNRALLLSAMANGTSHIHDVLIADDTRFMLDALHALGIEWSLDERKRVVRIAGAGGYWPSGEADLFCGNAGTVMRFLTAACCVGQGDYRLDGIERMRKRPLGELVNALRDLGANIGYEGESGFCPLTIRARGLRGGSVRFDHPPSSQFLSGILMAAPRAAQDVLIEVEGALPSEPFVRMTLGIMDAFGASVVEDRMQKFIVPAGQTYEARPYDIEPDATAASYFFAAAALTGGRVTIDGLGAESIQGDWHFVDILEQMGCSVERGPRTTTVRGPADGELRGIDVDLCNMPDVAQTLAVVAAFAEGPTHIRNVANLRIKETDRLYALSTELAHLGVETEVEADGIVIHPPGRLQPARINTYEDHRMAMSFSLAGLRQDGIVILDADCVGKTFPEFFDLWAELG